MKNTNFINMKDKEFAVICALCGMNHFFGSIDLKSDKLSKQEVYTILYSLYKKGFVVCQKDRMILRKDIESLFQDLKETERLLSIVSPLTSENQTFYYLPTKSDCINLQKSWEDPDSIKIRKVHKEDITEICEQAELFPPQILDKALVHHVTIPEEGHPTKEHLTIRLYHLIDAEQIVGVQVRTEGLNDIITYSDRGKVYREIYVLDRLKEIIARLLQEE